MSTLIKEELRAFLTTAYSSLLKEYILFTLAMAILGVVLPIFAVWILNRRDQNSVKKGKPYKAYTHRNQAERGIHVAICLMLPVLAARKLYLGTQLRASVDLYGWEIIALDIILLLLSVVAAWNLSKWRVRGLLMTAAFVFVYTACNQYQNLLAVKADMDFQAGLTPVGGYTLYIVHDYYVTRSMAESLLAVIALTFIACYDFQRRFLFLPGKLKTPRCDYCGQIISRGDAFCTCCGKRIEVKNRWATPVIETLDKKPYCGTCGHFTNGGVCMVCSKGTVDYLKQFTDKKKASWRRGAVLAICVVVLLRLNMAGPVESMECGSAAANDAFVQRWDEFYNDPDKASDPEWLTGFDSAANALNMVNARWYYVDPRAVKSDELVYFCVYADASFRQMEVVEQKQQAVHAAAEGQALAEEELTVLQGNFNQTIEAQVNARRYLAGLARSWDVLGKFEYLCLDGVHVFLPLVNITWAAAAVLAACMVMLVVLINHFSSEAVMGWEQRIQDLREKADTRISRYACTIPTAGNILHRAAAAGINCGRSLLRIVNEVWMLLIQLAGMAALLISLFRPKNIGGCIRWLKAGLTDPKDSLAAPYEAYNRSQRKAAIIAVVVVAVFFGVSFGVALLRNETQGQSDDLTYLTAAKAAATDYSADISKWILDICSTGSLTEEQKEQLYALMDMQIEADQTILNYDMSQLEEYQELHIGLCRLCQDDIDALRRLRAAIEEGRAPSKELQKNYETLRGENYLWVLQSLLSEFAVLDVEMIFE